MGRRKRIRGWRIKEAISAKQHRAKRLGGPSKPDYVRGDVYGEVKHRKKKVTKPEIKKIIQKALRRGASKVEIVSTAGFTKPAQQYVKRYYSEKVKLLRT